MIPRAFRILLPVPAPVEQQDTGDGGIFRPLSPVSDFVGGNPQVGRSEHARLTDGTADMWRQLVHLCWETPS